MRTFEQRVHDSNKGDIFSYDEVYRLKNIKFNSTEPTVPETDQFEKQKTYQLDKVDNILKIVENQNDQTSEILTIIEDNNSKLNQYTTFDEWGLSYDQNGNTTQKGTQHFTYDYRNQLITAQDLNATIDYKYDTFGRRAQKVIGSSTTRYFYDGNQVIEERDTSNNVLKQYIYGNGIDEVIRLDNYESGNPVPYYYHANAIGSVTAITDSSGNLVERITYDTFGMPTYTDSSGETISTSTIDNEYLFQGRRYDKETNLYYYRHRYYDPIMGRFLQTDPIGYAHSMNLYQAFIMNGINFVDPMGLVTSIPNRYPGLFSEVNFESGNKIVDYTILNLLNSILNLIGATFNATTGAIQFADNQVWNAIDWSSYKIGWSDRWEIYDDAQLRMFVDAVLIVNGRALERGVKHIATISDVVAYRLLKLLKSKGVKISGTKKSLTVIAPDEIALTADEMKWVMGGASPNSAGRRAVQGEFIDPLTNEVVRTTKTLAADHFIPQNAIKEFPGFNKLSKENKDFVLNLLDNFQGLPKTFNSSKGAKLPALWKKYKGMNLHPDYIKRNAELQEQLLKDIQALIDSLLMKQGG